MRTRPDHPDWTDVESCTLPTADRPLRLREFDELFTTALQSVERRGETRARMHLAGGADLAERTQRLVEAETSCCSFFGFVMAAEGEGRVVLDVEVPTAYADVLSGLVSRAQSAGGALR